MLRRIDDVTGAAGALRSHGMLCVMSSEVPSQPARQHTMTDWLVVHGLTQHSCGMLLADTNLLGGISSGSNRNARSVQIGISAEEAWTSAADAFAQFCPPSESVVRKVLQETRTNFQPDIANFPRPFTLHDAGDGRPFVSCAYRHNIGDVMAVAHEFGHALQITAAGGVFLPPVLRETCAFLSEIALLRHLKQHKQKPYRELLAVWHSDTARFLGSDKDKLSASLMDLTETYRYRWNYPPARILAIRCAHSLRPVDLWQIFTAGYSIGNIISKSEDWYAEGRANQDDILRPSPDHVSSDLSEH